MEWERLEAAAISSVGEREESRRTSESLQGTWHGRAQRGSLWLCYEESLVEKRKSGISGKQLRPKADSLGGEQLGDCEDEEGEPAIE